MQTGNLVFVHFANKLWRRTGLIFLVNGMTYIFLSVRQLIIYMTRIVWLSLLNSPCIWTDFWVSQCFKFDLWQIQSLCIAHTFDLKCTVDPILSSFWFNLCCDKVYLWQVLVAESLIKIQFVSGRMSAIQCCRLKTSLLLTEFLGVYLYCLRLLLIRCRSRNNFHKGVTPRIQNKEARENDLLQQSTQQTSYKAAPHRHTQAWCYSRCTNTTWRITSYAWANARELTRKLRE